MIRFRLNRHLQPVTRLSLGYMGRLLIISLAVSLYPAAGGWPAALDKPGAYPERPLTIIVPYGPGGGSHQMATNMAAALKDIIGVDVKVITRPGNSGKNGVNYYMSLPPDGYTILQQVDIFASMYASGKIDVNPVEDLTPLAITQITFSQIYIRNIDARFHDWPSFFSFAMANPGRVKVSTVGSKSSMEQVSMLLLKEAVGLDTMQTAYDHPAKRYMALIESEVDALFEQPGDVAPFLNRKLIKPILTFSTQRPSAFSDTPALADIGADIKPLMRFRGFFINSNVAESKRKWLEGAFASAFQSPSVKAFNKKQFMHLVDSYRDTEGARRLIEEAIENFRKIFERNTPSTAGSRK
jgi:tripartite-type tricarboxylate transporter receptor subunit TctC